MPATSDGAAAKPRDESTPGAAAAGGGHRYERRHPLDALFRPTSVAVIGASETAGSVGRALLWNLIRSPFGGPVFPVHPTRLNVLGIRTYPTLAALPEVPELAVIAAPADTVPATVHECGEIGVRGALIVSAGFREAGPAGAALEQRILEEARRYDLRLIGPNSLGVMSPASGLNATFASDMARRGNVAFLSQSTALGTAVLDWSLREHVGFSAFVSVGAMTDVGWGDLIDYLGHDAETRSIVIYMESIGHARAFLSAAREVALAKPIIVMKAGRSQAAARAGATHAATLTGDDEVLDAAFRRCGVLRVDNIADLFYMAEVLSKQPRPRGPRLTILTNAGAPGLVATDALVQNGGQLAGISPETLIALDRLLPAHARRVNPIDLQGDAGPGLYASVFEAAASDPQTDGLLVVLTPQAAADPMRTAECLAPIAKVPNKPVLASWMGGPAVAAGEQWLNASGIPTFPYPDTAARVFTSMWRYASALKALYETPVLPAGLDDIETGARARASALLDTVRRSGRTVLTEAESNVLLSFYDIPVVDAPGAAARAGTPAGDDTFEIIVGSSVDPQFGPVLLFGSGGRLVEVHRDRALGLPPLNTTLARRMMEQTRVYRALTRAEGGPPIDEEALAELLVRFSHLVCEQRAIAEIEINPLLVSPGQLVALGARVVVHPADLPDEAVPPLSIRPYPARYVRSFRLKDGRDVTIRPIRPEDEPAMALFHETLSDRSVYLRFFHIIKLGQRVSHERLARACFIDYDRDMALVAEAHDARGEPALIGVGRLTVQRGTRTGEFAILVSDQEQGQGLGTELLRRVVEFGRDQKLERIVADILPENQDMQHVSEKVGFTCRYLAEDQIVKAELAL